MLYPCLFLEISMNLHGSWCSSRASAGAAVPFQRNADLPECVESLRSKVQMIPAGCRKLENPFTTLTIYCKPRIKHPPNRRVSRPDSHQWEEEEETRRAGGISRIPREDDEEDETKDGEEEGEEELQLPGKKGKGKMRTWWRIKLSRLITQNKVGLVFFFFFCSSF